MGYRHRNHTFGPGNTVRTEFGIRQRHNRYSNASGQPEETTVTYNRKGVGLASVLAQLKI
jgi:hypothetical protein